ncbi:YitT family protein [Bacillaceae bacterium W0354]
MSKKRGGPSKWEQLIYIIVGSFIVALAYNGFLLPNYVAAGGVSGISTILEAMFGFEPAYVIWAINIPILMIGFFIVGRASALRSVAGSLILPFFVFITRHIEPFSDQLLLAAIFGGIGVGVGLGIVYLGDASTGGTSLIAQMIHKLTNISLGTSLVLIDGLIVIAAIFVFSLEAGLFALICLYMTSKSINIVQTGFNQTKTTLIITSKHIEVQEAIYQQVDRGVTRITAQGGFTEEERPVLMCVVNQMEMGKLKRTVKQVDKEAFVIVMDSSEVLGRGFYEAI